MTETDRQDAFDAEVRRYVYEHAMTEGVPPQSSVAAAALSCSTDEVQVAFRRLADARVLVLQEGAGEILMAAPFSAVPTPFVVRSGARAYFFAPCAWDALGVPVVLGRDAEVEASCGCCGTRMSLRVEGGALVEDAPDSVVHFALPAARWWENVVFT